LKIKKNQLFYCWKIAAYLGMLDIFPTRIFRGRHANSGVPGFRRIQQVATLILSMDGLVLKEINLTPGRITIGRKPHNNVQLVNPGISGEHAAITTILNDSFLEDLDSTNGTQVNGKPVQKHALRHNDVVEMGQYKFKYLNDPDQDDQSAHIFIEETPDPTPVMLNVQSTVFLEHPVVDVPPAASPRQTEAAPIPLPSAKPELFSAPNALGNSAQVPSVRAEPVEALVFTGNVLRQAQGERPCAETSPPLPMPEASPAAAPPPVKIAVMRILSGAMAGRELPLKRETTTLGKVGVQVARIIRTAQGYFITHDEGAFPIINGTPMQAFGDYLLQEWDVVEMQGGLKMEFALKQA
jgi:hypothetical protein